MLDRFLKCLACAGFSALPIVCVAQAVDGGMTERGGPGDASRPVAAAPGGPAELERAFWDCDHAATKRLISPSEAGECSAATEAVLRTFGGDFPTMLAWWQRNKAAEHLARERAIGRNAP